MTLGLGLTSCLKDDFIRITMPIETMEIGAIYEGDNIRSSNRFPDKSIDLIYADLPFFTNATIP